jgi:2-oxoglutarate dehydrogenase E1 component
MQYMHMPDRAKCNWLRERIELSSPFKFSAERKKSILDRLAWSDMFETFLANKYAAAKRFGLEGAESLIPGMKALIDTAANEGVRSVVIGMPHRGRLNVLGNVVRKPLRQIFTEFGGKAPTKGSDQYLGSLPQALHRTCSCPVPTCSHLSLHDSLSHVLITFRFMS